MATYTISVIYLGRRYDFHYCPTRYGRRSGCLNSFSEFQHEMIERCGDSHLEFYYIPSSGQSKQISNDRQLRTAVTYLDDGDVLGVTASGITGPNVYWDEESVEEESTEESSDEEESESEDSELENVEVDEEESESDTSLGYDDEEILISNRLSKIVKRFVNPSSECYYDCRRKNFSGLGYIYRSSPSHNICDSCYGSLPRSQKRDWVRCRLPWDDDVPAYPLKLRSDYAVLEEVKQLQYILTRLGFMSLNATSKLTGSYQSRTQEAVRRFREHYNLHGGDMTKYDKKTASKLRQVVRQRRREGHQLL